MHSSIHKIITGPRMAAAWTQVNRVASQQLVAVLSGSGGKNGAIGVSNGKVTLDIAPLEAVAKQDLVARGLRSPARSPSSMPRSRYSHPRTWSRRRKRTGSSTT